MMEYDLVFVVLTYRNTQDLKDFISSVKIKIKSSYKIIIVNSFFDQKSYNQIYSIAEEHDCDFINVPNKGYSYGNNRGIEFARANYKFKYLIISNPDIEIIDFQIEMLEGMESYIIAPHVETLTGKIQNPIYYKKMELFEWLIYMSCKKNIPFLSYVSRIINKIYRELIYRVDKIKKVKSREVYAVIGCFVIVGSRVFDKIDSLYNENMFLFSEENHLARLADFNSVKTILDPRLKVLHKEDGSVNLEDRIIISKYACDSFIIYYEFWKRKR